MEEEMISPAYDLAQFVEKVRGNDYFAIIRTAELEATEGERLSLRLKNAVDTDFEKRQSYVSELKCLIYFLRYGFFPSHLEDYQYTLFNILCEEMSQNGSILPR
jgi:hypothetical protein